MKYTKSSSVFGSWARASEIVSGSKVKLVTESTPSQGEYGEQNIAKARFQGASEDVNVRLNKITINGLIDAFGDDSKDWIGKVLTAQTEKAIVGGKRVTILYLVPEGFELQEGDDGYVTITKKGEASTTEEVSSDDIPF
jgi:hypothetical protein